MGLVRGEATEEKGDVPGDLGRVLRADGTLTGDRIGIGVEGVLADGACCPFRFSRLL